MGRPWVEAGPAGPTLSCDREVPLQAPHYPCGQQVGPEAGELHGGCAAPNEPVPGDRDLRGGRQGQARGLSWAGSTPGKSCFPEQAYTHTPPCLCLWVPLRLFPCDLVLS